MEFPQKPLKVGFIQKRGKDKPKWAPRYVRVMKALPVTASDKVDKKPLRSQRWETEDPVWHRVCRSDRYVPLESADRDRLARAFEANGRSGLIGR